MPRVAITENGYRSLLFFEPPTSLTPEVDINTLIYLCRDSTDNPAYVSKKTISQFILNPTKVTAEFATLKMRSIDLHDQCRPDHFPSIEDDYRLPELIKRIITWFLEKHHTVPHYLQHLIDPKPVLDLTNPIEKLQFDPLYLCMGYFTDAFQVVEPPEYPSVVILTIVRAPDSKKRAPYYKVTFEPVLSLPWVANVHPLRDNTRIATWNVRGITRDSFRANLKLVNQAFNPSILVLLETRHGLENVKLIVDLLPQPYNLLHKATPSFGGGAVILWKKELVTLLHNPSFPRNNGCNAVLQGTRAGQDNSKSVTEKARRVLRGIRRS